MEGKMEQREYIGRVDDGATVVARGKLGKSKEKWSVWTKGVRAADLPARGWFTRCYRSSGLPIIATTALTNKTELGCAASPELPERSMGTNSSRKNTNSNSQQKDNSNSRTEPYQ
jgi:hypothetical protein